MARIFGRYILIRLGVSGNQGVLVDVLSRLGLTWYLAADCTYDYLEDDA